MPIMDGYEATRLIRHDAQLQSLPIIAMTAHATFQDRDLCLRAGMNDFVTKPTSRKALLTVLAKWVGTVSLAEDAESIPSESVSAGAEPWFPQGIPGISLEAAFALYGGNRVLFLKLLKQFLITRSCAAEEIRTELSNGHLEDALRIAHTMKSVSGAIAAEELSRSAAVLEISIRDRLRELWNDQLENFENQLCAVLHGISVSLSTVLDGPPTTNNIASEKPIVVILGELRRLLDVDVGMATLLRDEIHHRFSTGKAAEEFRRFEERLALYDLTGAKASVDKLIAQLGLSPGAL
jgi:HPt (histidine-containing phosphotransfer) domain-containing protein